MATRRTSSKGQASSASSNGTSRSRTGRSSGTSAGSKANAANAAAGNDSASSTGRRRTRASEASAAGATARARIGSTRRGGRAGTRPKAKPDASIAEPTVTATDEVLAASNAQKALSPDMPRVAWLRTQLQNLEAERAERLMKVGQLTLIAIVFITFVLQNSEGVNVTFLLFSLNIRLIWVIVGCGLLGGFAGYLLGRPEKSLRALLQPEKAKRTGTKASRTARI